MAVQDEMPKSRVTLTYKTEVDGEPSVVNLPLRLLILGDFSAGSSKDRQIDLEERRIRNLDGKNTSDVMKDMHTCLDLTVSNKINPSSSENIQVSLSIDNINAFSPKEIAKQVPQIRSLLMLKQLLLELQADIANKKELNLLLNKLYSDKTLLSEFKERLKRFSVYKLPIRKEEKDEDGNPNGE